MLVRSHPRQAFDVPADEVHHDGLRSIIEIVAGREVSRTDIAGLLVHEHAAEHPAVGAGAAAPGDGSDRIHGDSELGERPQMENDIVLLAEPPDDVDARRTVSFDALVDGNRMDLDAIHAVEYGGEHLEGDHAVLAAGHRYGDLVTAFHVNLLADLPLHTAVNVTHEVLGAQVRAVVTHECDRIAVAEIAGRHRHRRSCRGAPPSSEQGPSRGCPEGTP